MPMFKKRNAPIEFNGHPLISTAIPINPHMSPEASSHEIANMNENAESPQTVLNHDMPSWQMENMENKVPIGYGKIFEYIDNNQPVYNQKKDEWEFRKKKRSVGDDSDNQWLPERGILKKRSGHVIPGQVYNPREDALYKTPSTGRHTHSQLAYRRVF